VNAGLPRVAPLIETKRQEEDRMSPEEFLIHAYKQMDLMKTQISAR
jgi:hypothetical protein